MEKQNEKLSLLADMIAFSIIDGKLHDREYQFIKMIAKELKISKNDFKNLFHQEEYPKIIKLEFERIQQFYRLALLMHSDGILHEKEHLKIHEVGINMGLNPHAIKRVLKAMEKSPTNLISSKILLDIFKEQHN